MRVTVPGASLVHLAGVLLLGGLCSGSAASAAAQERPRERPDEAAVLRTAIALESRGRYADARTALEELLERQPTSSGALFSLERVLRPLGDVGAILPWTDRFLEREPVASGARYLKLRVLSEIDSVAGIAPAVEDWVRAEPRSPEPYREGARVLEEHAGGEAALALLRRGEAALGTVTPLALELGDVLLRMGDQRAAVEAWARAVGEEGREASAVLRRLQNLDGDRAEAVRPLLDALDDDPPSLERLRLAVRVAVTAQLSERAIELADRAAGRLETGARRGFLVELAAEADREGLPGVSLWAYRSLRELPAREGVGGDRERRALDERIAEAALAAGDTAVALEARKRLLDALPAGSAERRRALADVIRIEARRSDAEPLLRRLEAFRREFPGAPELDGLASAVSAGLRARGLEAEAARVLEGVSGPRSALERAWLLFEEGGVEEGIEALLASVPGLEPDRATSVIQLAALLERVSPPTAALVATSAGLAHRGSTAEALERVEAGLADVPAQDRPAILAHAARLADDGGLEAEGATLRERLLEGHPDAPETAEATLDLARWRARQPDGVADAVRLLEQLILERPNSAVVPAARRELERLRSGSAS